MALTPVFTLALEGDYISLKSKGRAVAGGKHERGEVQGFSFRSRSRLMAKISQLRKHHLPLFVTLTYPDQYPVEWEEFKADLHRFLVAIRKKYPTFGCIWKLEFQARGAAHFHLMVWGLDLETAQNYIPRLWFKIAGHQDAKHYLFHTGQLKNEHCVQAVRSWRGVKSYASKYLSKLDERTERSGRFWGVVGEVPFSPLWDLAIDMQTALAFRRAFARKTGMSFKRFGFWGWGAHKDWIRFIMMNEWRLQDQRELEAEAPESPPAWWEVYLSDKYKFELEVF